VTLTVSPCAVCEGRAFSLVYSRTVSDGDDPALYYSSSRVRAGHLDIVRCDGCGLIMTNPRDDDATVARVYAGLKDATYDDEDDSRRRTAGAYVRLIERHRLSPGRLLDVGCATGVFAAVAAASGWTVTGVEASNWAIARARRRCPGATFVEGMLEDVSLPSAAFDVVTLWDVLEHVRSPAETLSRARQWLAPGGWLFLNLPNAGDIVSRTLGKRWVLLLREHLWYFDPNTMGALLGKCGFELIYTRPNSVTFSLRNALVRASQYPGGAGRMAARLAQMQSLRRLRVRCRIGEMQVVARPSAGH
jgi:2-polyprenyl-3-methyl-5-hydroxy-6-metoxy-1,4-benzoquinol methylase